MTSRKILVTGADGSIGSHLAESLVRAGHDVRALVLYNSFGSRGWLDHADPALVGGMEIIGGDVRDGSAMRALVQGRDVVMHLAALIAIPFSYRAPETYVETNVRGRSTCCRPPATPAAAFRADLDQRGLRHRPQRADQGEPSADRAIALLGHQDRVRPDGAVVPSLLRLPVSVIRPFNTYGPRQSTRAVIPTIISQLVAGQRHLRLGALRPTRDFTFVTDTVAAFFRAIDAPEAVGQTINLGSGFEISIGDTARMIAEVMGTRPKSRTTRRGFARPTARSIGCWPDRPGPPTTRLVAGLRRARRHASRLGRDERVVRDPANLARYKAGYTML